MSLLEKDFDHSTVVHRSFLLRFAVAVMGKKKAITALVGWLSVLRHGAFLCY